MSFLINNCRRSIIQIDYLKGVRMLNCYCPQCKTTTEFQINERLGVKAAASVVGGLTKVAGFVADQVTYEEDKRKDFRPIADAKLASNKAKTDKYAETSARWTESLAGGTKAAHCLSCKNVIEFPQARDFDEYRMFTHLSNAHKNRIPMAVIGFLLGAGVAALFGKFGSNATYSLLCIGMAVAGYFSPRFLSPVWNNYLRIAFGSMSLIWGLSFGLVAVSVMTAPMGSVALGISLVAYCAGAGWLVYKKVRSKLNEQQELFCIKSDNHQNAA